MKDPDQKAAAFLEMQEELKKIYSEKMEVKSLPPPKTDTHRSHE